MVCASERKKMPAARRTCRALAVVFGRFGRGWQSLKNEQVEKQIQATKEAHTIAGETAKQGESFASESFGEIPACAEGRRQKLR